MPQPPFPPKRLASRRTSGGGDEVGDEVGDVAADPIDVYVREHGLDELLEVFRILAAWDDEPEEARGSRE